MAATTRVRCTRLFTEIRARNSQAVITPIVDLHVRARRHVATHAAGAVTLRLVEMMPGCVVAGAGERGEVHSPCRVMALGTHRIAGKAELTSVRIMAVGTRHAAHVHAALDKRTPHVNLVLDRPITLMGADESAVLWNNEAEGDDGVEPTVKVMATTGVVRLSGLTITGAGPGVWVGHSSAGAALDGVLIEDVQRYGFEDRHKAGQDSLLTDVVIRTVRPRPGRTTGLGLSAWAGARVVAQRLLIEDVKGAGVWTNHWGQEPAVVVTMRDSLIREVRNDAPDGFREPIRLRNLAAVTLERVVIDGFDGPGLLTGVFEGGPLRATVAMTDVVFRNAAVDDPELPRWSSAAGSTSSRRASRSSICQASPCS